MSRVSNQALGFGAAGVVGVTVTVVCVLCFRVSSAGGDESEGECCGGYRRCEFAVVMGAPRDGSRPSAVRFRRKLTRRQFDGEITDITPRGGTPDVLSFHPPASAVHS